MTNVQKEKIDKMRNDGRTYKDIGFALSIPETTVKAYCYRKKQQQPSQAEPAHNSSGVVDELRLLNSRETAKILRVNTGTVYSLWSNGLLDYWCIHKSLKTNMKAIGEFLEKTKNTELNIK